MNKDRKRTLIQPSENGLCDFFEVLWEELGVQDCVLTYIKVLIPAKDKG
jgi:hypothetical protein